MIAPSATVHFGLFLMLSLLFLDTLCHIGGMGMVVEGVARSCWCWWCSQVRWRTRWGRLGWLKSANNEQGAKCSQDGGQSIFPLVQPAVNSLRNSEIVFE